MARTNEHSISDYGSIIASTCTHQNEAVLCDDCEGNTSTHYKHGFYSSGHGCIHHVESNIDHPQTSSIENIALSSTISHEISNLIKNIIGAGAFGIPSGFAAMANASRSKWTMIPTGGIILLMALVFDYYFILIARICEMTGSVSYREAWDRSIPKEHKILTKVSFLVPLCVTLTAGLGNLAYSMILADTTRSLLATLGVHTSRTSSLLAVTLFVLLPLCMVKKLSILTPFSAIGTGGFLLTLVVIAMRWIDGTYESNGGGKFIDSSSDWAPSFLREDPPPIDQNASLLFCMCYQAFFCHYNAPRFYIELRQNTIPRLSLVSHVSFGISAVVYFLIGVFGYYTFGKNTNSFILNNYSTNDNLVTICRVAITVAFAFTYPLPFIGTRDGILDLFSVSSDWRTLSNLNILSVLILSVITCMAWSFTDLGLVNAVGGAALVTSVVFIFPSIMFYFIVTQQMTQPPSSLRCESLLVLLLMTVGTSMSVIGVTIVVTNDHLNAIY